MKRIALTAAVILALSSMSLPSAEAGAETNTVMTAQVLRGPMMSDWAQLRRGAAVRRGFVARGPRGGTIAGLRTAVVRPGFRPYPYRPVRPVPVPVRPAWVRPPGYWWRPGAAVAAGAALGFVSATAATAYINSRPPAPGYCWYYTNPQRTQGFWDVCPR